MTAKQYLKQAYHLNELINTDISEAEQLRRLSTSISSPNLSGMPSSGRKTEAPFVNCVNKLIDLEAKINAEIDSYVDLKEEIRQKVTAIDDIDAKLLLQSRYLLFMTWEQIAESMGFTTQWVYELHKRALALFSEKYNL